MDVFTWVALLCVFKLFTFNAKQLFALMDETFLQMAQKATVEKQMQLETFKALFKLLIPYQGGLNAVATLIFAWMALFVTQKRLLLLNQWKAPTLLLSNLELPMGFLIFSVALTAGWLILPNQWPLTTIMGNFSILFLGAYLLQGIGIVHYFAKNHKNTQMILVIFYGIMVMFSWLIMVIIALGVLEPWINLKERLMQRKE